MRHPRVGPLPAGVAIGSSLSYPSAEIEYNEDNDQLPRRST